MPDVKSLIEKDNTCLDERDNIPNAPLWHMGKVAVFKAKESFESLQNTIDYPKFLDFRKVNIELK